MERVTVDVVDEFTTTTIVIVADCSGFSVPRSTVTVLEVESMECVPWVLETLEKSGPSPEPETFPSSEPFPEAGSGTTPAERLPGADEGI